MSQDSLIGFFSLASIAIAGGLGIAGTITETKDKKGKLTKWGMIALAGIIISNSFSFLQTYFQREKEAAEKLAEAETEKIQAVESTIRYKEQIDRLSSIVSKSDSSLKQQLTLQKQSELLTEQQKHVAGNLDRTLNPLLPFKINISLTVLADSNSVWLITLTKLLKEKIGEIEKKTGAANSINQMEEPVVNYLKKMGVFPLPADKKSYLLKPEYIYYNDLVKLFSNVSISLSFAKNYHHSAKAINCEVPKEYLKTSSNFKDFLLVFYPETESYFFIFEDLPVRVSSDLQTGTYSIKDIENSVFTLLINSSPGFIKQSDIVFKFPPDFSRINYLNNKNKGSNVLTVYNYYDYSYRSDVKFFY
jgi:hypothetical protein